MVKKIKTALSLDPWGTYFKGQERVTVLNLYSITVLDRNLKTNKKESVILKLFCKIIVGLGTYHFKNLDGRQKNVAFKIITKRKKCDFQIVYLIINTPYVIKGRDFSKHAGILLCWDRNEFVKAWLDRLQF